MSEGKRITIRVLRTDGDKQWWQSYEVPFVRGMTVLDALNYIRENIDSSLAFRHHCRMGVCGSCAVVVNGRPRLACNTQIAKLNANVIKLEPLYNFPIVRDLVVELDDFFKKHRSIKPFIIRKNVEERESPKLEYYVSPKDHERFLQFTYCIMCGSCVAACPTVSADEKYPGPMALTQAYRYLIDPRDEGWRERMEILDDQHGVWRCHFAGACSYVCPKGVDPAMAIQLLKAEVFKYRFGKKKEGSKEVEAPKVVAPPPTAKKPPPFDFPVDIKKILGEKG